MSRIAIITADIEITGDGVADYSRLLADELVRQGHKVLIIGLMQQSGQWLKYLPGNTGPEASGNFHLAERIEKARDVIDRFNPDFISFQYVCFSFGRYGLPLNIGRAIRTIAGNRPVELMSHELWTGISRPADLKTYLLGTLQQWNYKRFLHQLRPAVVHVSNPAYVRLLQRIGQKAKVLPLFGNIPVNAAKDAWLESQMNCISFLIFGSIHPEWLPEPLLPMMIALAEKLNKKPLIVSAGSQGRGVAVWQAMVERYQSEVAFHALGRMDAERVSALMNSADFAIATSPLSLIGKSGTAAAMLEHDMPVIVTRDEPCYSVGRVEPEEGFSRFIRPDPSFEMQMMAEMQRERKPQSRLPNVAGDVVKEMAFTNQAKA
ncbi:MAG: hypothetical protein ACKO5E_22115 [bacterium]